MPNKGGDARVWRQVDRSVSRTMIRVARTPERRNWK